MLRSLLGGLAASLMVLGTAQAAAPQVKTQPGYYRLMLGEFEVTALSDGTVKLPMDKMLHARPGQVEQQYARAFVPLPAEVSVNAYLVNTGTKLVLIDAGAAGLFGPTLGKLIDNLRAAGYQPEQVDEVYLTHLHSDHAGGLVQGGQRLFPNAVVRAERADADFWLNPASLEKAPAEAKDAFRNAMAVLKPYADAGKFQTFDSGAELVPGIQAVPLHGHTPGHNGFLVRSQGQRLLVWGDVMHAAPVQMKDPGVTIQFDSDTRSAAATRRKVMAEVAREGTWVAGAHLSFPGLGHLRAVGKGYEWVPAHYSIPAAAPASAAASK
ncbi:MBL fold metallo-hydrolase [Azohydromonas caseinilytica]|uniref:MBL fold metallo-hydrolase n=1 Tax=Azohydromonas caseinilytica TaxID=2728836 RepID=A0A848F599_9BURK|nr:MBL fold metallo-hydrolase [Azohydromonas caseinilytica]NML15227.1 MBL fold metallo-hydrolase [Azohydromonas caseinilytica]